MSAEVCNLFGRMSVGLGVRARIATLRQILARPAYNGRVKYLGREGVLEWIYGEPEWVRKMRKEGSEREWGIGLIGYVTNQWTTELGEHILGDILEVLDKNPRKIKVHQRAANGKRLDPDRDADDGLYECKARNYSTTGTAGEKIMGCPIKYCEVPRLYGKPLYIVCLGFQEVEAEKEFHLFAPQSEELKLQIAFWKDVLRIEFKRATDLLGEIIERDACTQGARPHAPQACEHESPDAPKTLRTLESLESAS
jgi:hypothetical protein